MATRTRLRPALYRFCSVIHHPGTRRKKRCLSGLLFYWLTDLEWHHYLVDVELHRRGFNSRHHRQLPVDVYSLAGFVQCAKKNGRESGLYRFRAKLAEL